MAKKILTVEEILDKFAHDNKHWPPEQLAAALWAVRWQLTALPHQKEPDDPYDIFLMLAGRGAGKTHTASNWIGLRAWRFPGTRWLITGPTSNDVRQTMIEGDSGLMGIIPSQLIGSYNRTLSEIELKNGSLIQGIPASEPERYRGKQYHGGWFDELAAFDKLEEAWDGAQFTMRLKHQGIERVQSIVTTTPKPRPLIVDLADGKTGHDVYKVTVSSYANRKNMSDSFFKSLEQYEGTELGQQEIHAAILDPEQSGIVKRTQFRRWPHNRPWPKLEYVVVSYDPATSEKTVNDPTACVALGIFENEETTLNEKGRVTSVGGLNAILLDAWDDHLNYPELRRRVTTDHKELVYGGDSKDMHKGRKADLILMEDKSAGISLIQELQRSGAPVRAYNPGKADKVQRLNIVAPLIQKGLVWLPEAPGKPGEFEPWVQKFLRQVCTFPAAGKDAHDDYVDALTQALRILRDSGWLQLDPLPPRDDIYREDRASRKVNPYAV
jgi:predicted phage terminase large subunit-like protein